MHDAVQNRQTERDQGGDRRSSRWRRGDFHAADSAGPRARECAESSGRHSGAEESGRQRQMINEISVVRVKVAAAALEAEAEAAAVRVKVVAAALEAEAEAAVVRVKVVAAALEAEAEAAVLKVKVLSRPWRQRQRQRW
eukprot:2446501-Pleurochrysis_carterae.AAC.1